MRAPSPTVDQQRVIRREYTERPLDGRYRYAVLEVATRNGVSPSTVLRVAKTWGLGRYLTRGAA